MEDFFEFGTGVIYGTLSSIISLLALATIGVFDADSVSHAMNTMVGGLVVVLPIMMIVVFWVLVLCLVPIVVLLRFLGHFKPIPTAIAGSTIGAVLAQLDIVFPATLEGFLTQAFVGFVAALFFWIGCRKHRAKGNKSGTHIA